MTGPGAALNLEDAADAALGAAYALNGSTGRVAAQFAFGGRTYVAIDQSLPNGNGIFTDTVDLLIDIKKNQARAFFASYGDMADAFARNEVTASAIGWEAVAVWAKGKGKTISVNLPLRAKG